MTATANEIQIIIAAQKAQIANPCRAVVNCEASFVEQTLNEQGHCNLARRYWSWVCMGQRKDVFGQEVYDLQQQLKAIDDGQMMPAWGISGT